MFTEAGLASWLCKRFRLPNPPVLVGVAFVVTTIRLFLKLRVDANVLSTL
jgi:hypothetical protein